LIGVQKLKKEEIVNIVKELPLEKEDFMITGSSAMVMQDLIKETEKITIKVAKKINNLENPNITVINENFDKKQAIKINNYYKINQT